MEPDIFNREFYRLSPGAAPRIQSRMIDQLIAPDIHGIERMLSHKHPSFNKYDYEKSELFENSQPWIGLHPEILQTPYALFLELYEYVEGLYKINSIVDVGAAYGRGGFVKAAVFPKASFTGYEIVTERAEEANRLFKHFQLDDCTVLCKNALTEKIMNADLYLVYDFSNESDIHQVLKILTKKSSFGHNFLLAALGESTPKIIEKYFIELYAVGRPSSKSGWNLYSTFP